MKKIGIFGGTNGVGKECVKQALSEGYNLTVLARDPSKLSDIKHENLKIIKGDVLNSQSVDEVCSGNEVILNCLGSKVLRGNGVDICSKGTEIILNSMKKLGPKKIITCTSLGTGDSYARCSFFTKLFVNLIIKNPIADKVIQEDLIKKSGLDFIIIRPSGLIDKPGKGNYTVSFDISGGRVARADVANWIVKQINSNEWIGKSPSMTGN